MTWCYSLKVSTIKAYKRRFISTGSVESEYGKKKGHVKKQSSSLRH